MAGDQLLFLELAKALGQDSRPLRAVKAAAEIPLEAMKGYNTGAEFSDSIRKRKLEQMPLSEILGQMPEGTEGYGNLTQEQFKPTSEILTGIAALRKANREPTQKPRNLQQVQGVVYNNRPAVFDPDPNLKNHMFYADTMDPVDFGATPSGGSGGTPAVPSPKVPPTLPNEAIDFNTRASTIAKTLQDIRSTYKPEYVGPVAGPVSKIIDTKTPWGNPDRSLFRNRVAKAFNDLVYLRTGKQLNQDESVRMADEFISKNNTPVAFNSALTSMTEEMNGLVSNRRKGYLQAGYRVGGVGDTGNDSSNPPNKDPLGIF